MLAAVVQFPQGPCRWNSWRHWLEFAVVVGWSTAVVGEAVVVVVLAAAEWLLVAFASGYWLDLHLEECGGVHAGWRWGEW